ncbi:diguanylate cyclase, partial [Streptomyces sp. P9(2023)]|uniref:diguanylate cyclase domain-containing protein n=1 Tax=Streptomyces sp. P9(2023) TaxID=3064394 RepID=UPI0028F3EAE6
MALLPVTDLDEAERRANELLQTLRTHALFHHQQPLGYITLSCGIAAYPEHTDSRHSLIKMADQALYQAKHRGRDR